ncbi:MAG: carbohydrate kinase [Planctomycetaceae bacterium]|nr:carbohydrate kinase [Planctomycetaceae bacterium]
MIGQERLQGLLEQFPGQRIGLLGDLFLDRYLELAADVCEHSIETGLEAYQVACVRNAPGALGTVLNNLAALGVGELVPITVIGDDGHGFDLLKQLSVLPVNCQHVCQSQQRMTPTYTKPLRPVAGGWEELHRLDVRTRAPLNPEDLGWVIENLKIVFAETDGLIVLDQIDEDEWGVVGEAVRGTLLELVRGDPDKLVFIDSRSQISQFCCGHLKGNRDEFIRGLQRLETAGAADSKDAVRALAARTGRVAFCTMGEQGVLVAFPDGVIEVVPGVVVDEPVDIVGAGDAVTSATVAALLAGATPVEAATLGNLAASITIRQLGTTGTASPDQLLNAVCQVVR